MRLRCKKEGSKLILDDLTWSQVMFRLKDGVKYELIISKPKKRRTNKQNSTYHMLRAWWVEMQQQDGNIYSPIDSEYWFKYWMGWMQESEYITQDGEVVTQLVPKNTRDLTTSQISDIYKLIVDKAHAWWPECVVPRVEFE